MAEATRPRPRLSGVSPLARASKRSKPEDVAKIFKEADANGDGVLSLEELQAYLGDYLGYGDTEIRAFFAEHKGDNGVDTEGLQKGFASLNPYLVSKRQGALIVRKPGSVCAPGGQMNLEDLTDCTVLVCDRSEQVFVDECKNCRVLIGPCNSSTFIRDCVGCTFWVATRQLRTRDCKDCKFFLHSHTEPIIESSKDLSFGPFCASYPGLSRHFEESQLDGGRNFWSAIFDFTGRPDGANWRLLALEECQELAVEFLGEGPEGAWDCPAPALSHEVICASPLQSADGSGNSVASIPQTRPSKPDAPAAGVKPQRLLLSDAAEGAKAKPQAESKPSKGEAAGAVAAPVILRKPKWITVDNINPDSRGVNVFVKVVKVTQIEGAEGTSEVVVGDATAVVTLRARGEEVTTCLPGRILRIQNARASVFKGFVRLEITKWGVVKPAPDDHADFEPKVSQDISAVEYELKES
ncbi:unnamed protein product [Polarella glacialis]|uniref:Calmodulin n=1 Tax=Polarella glacialis TaxID=89957 RepID=A0A813EL57_POLGL|nr:unnamed protein product [Polarella glacialis]